MSQLCLQVLNYSAVLVIKAIAENLETLREQEKVYRTNYQRDPRDWIIAKQLLQRVNKHVSLYRL